MNLRAVEGDWSRPVPSYKPEYLNTKIVPTTYKNIPKNIGSSPEYIEKFSRAILTTDTHPKVCYDSIENSMLLGIAKGSGMIEPNMATMLSFFVTDAQLSSKQLQFMLKRVVDKSFNRISIDSDTSTSDAVIILANGLAGPVDAKWYEDLTPNTGMFIITGQ